MPDFGKRKLLSHFTDRKCRAYHPPLHSRCLRPSRYCGALPTRTPPTHSSISQEKQKTET